MTSALTNFHYRFSKIYLALCFSLALSTGSTQIPQVYFDGCFNMDHFTNLQDYEIRNPQLSYAFRAGVGFFENEQENFKLNGELGFSRRVLVRDFPGQDVSHSIFGIDLSVLAEVMLLTDVWLEGGIGYSTFSVNLRNNESTAQMGSGFSSNDLLLHGGASVRIAKSFFIGSRVRYGVFPALTYTPIAPLGGFGNEKKIVNALTHELYLRFKILE